MRKRTVITSHMHDKAVRRIPIYRTERVTVVHFTELICCCFVSVALYCIRNHTNEQCARVRACVGCLPDA